jgi:hypothetical protein
VVYTGSEQQCLTKISYIIYYRDAMFVELLYNLLLSLSCQYGIINRVRVLPHD